MSSKSDEAYRKALEIAEEFLEWFKEERGKHVKCDRYFEGAIFAAQHIANSLKIESEKGRKR